jgi:hypothetical protein
MNTGPNRTCPFCAEAISDAAKVCPRCRQWLTRRSLRHPVTAAFILGIPVSLSLLVMVTVLLNKFDRAINPRPYYTECPGSLRVIDSRMNWAQASDGPLIYLVGVITNQSQVAWKEVEFECRLFNGQGVMIDAASTHTGVTIEPNDDSGFRLIVRPSRATNEYASYKISVSTARNRKALF